MSGVDQLPFRIFHLALRAEWEEALDSGGDYRRSTLGTSLEDEGFIHCSFADQVQAIADLVYRGRSDVVLLAIDPSRLTAEVRIENLQGGIQRFPHIYGPLPLQAVVQVIDAPPDVGLSAQRAAKEARIGNERSVRAMETVYEASAIACFDQTLVDVGIAGDDRLRQVLHDYFAWATRTTMSRYHDAEGDVPDSLVIPQWSWDGLVRGTGPADGPQW